MLQNGKGTVQKPCLCRLYRKKSTESENHPQFCNVPVNAEFSSVRVAFFIIMCYNVKNAETVFLLYIAHFLYFEGIY